MSTTVERRLNAWLKMYNQRIVPILEASSDDLLVVTKGIAERYSAVRDQVPDFLGIPCSSCPEVLFPGKYHLVAVSPMRFKDETRIRYDERWRITLDASMVELVNEYNWRLHPALRARLMND